MDIRSYFQKGISTIKRKKGRDSSSGSDENGESPQEPVVINKSQFEADDECHNNDVGRYVGRANTLTIDEKKNILQNPWVPEPKYDFKADASSLQRKFNYAWLEQYAPWLVYSKRLKGAICKYCVLFPPVPGTVRGVLGSFMIRPFLKYKNMHEDCKKHVATNLHLDAAAAAKAFLQDVPVDIQLQNSHQKQIAENREVISSIISCVVFCGTHDMPFRGKETDGGVFMDLMHLRIDSGDTKLKSHVEKCSRNALYTSPQIQNDLIKICGEVIEEQLISDVKKYRYYSVLADETADISGTEQLSIGLRFFDKTTSKIREDFVGFIPLKAQDANTISQEIDKYISSQDLLPKYCIGFGFDGCSTMAGKHGGVYAILKNKYTKALYFHCSSHKLNLVVNDVSQLQEIRNCISTIKECINFFRESTTRRSVAPNLSKLCETRWSEKYKSVRRFSENFCHVVSALEHLSKEGNSNTRKSAIQLHAVITKPVFIIALLVIAKYSKFLEPTANVLQSVSIDMVATSNHIEEIIELLNNDRQNAEHISQEICDNASIIASQLNVEITVPRLSHKQQYRSNPPSSNLNEYWRRSIVIPYIDSLLASLRLRFPKENSPAFALSQLHPAFMFKNTLTHLETMAKQFETYYDLENIVSELKLWYNHWQKKDLPINDLKKLEVVEIFAEANEFFPQMQEALTILSALPCTTASVERSFSTLRRVKTWLRSTMSDQRLTGLCLMSVHRKMVNESRTVFKEKVIEKFSTNPRRLLLL